MAERMLLFGGTFDPVHNGHLIVARCLAERCGFAKVTLVPAGRPPHKAEPGATPEQRLDMLRLAIEGEDVFDICPDELDRAGASYTFDTLAALRQRHGPETELHWAIGADMLADLPNWHRALEVVAMARIVVAARPPWHLRMEGIVAELRERLPSEVVDRLAEAVVRTPLIEISSTDIRTRVRERKSLCGLVPERVREYIEGRGLYSAQSV